MEEEIERYVLDWIIDGIELRRDKMLELVERGLDRENLHLDTSEKALRWLKSKKGVERWKNEPR